MLHNIKLKGLAGFGQIIFFKKTNARTIGLVI